MSAQLGSASPCPVALRSPRGVRQVGWMATLRQVLRMIETRQHLAELDERMLRDIGMTKAEAVHESRRAAWDSSRRV